MTPPTAVPFILDGGLRVFHTHQSQAPRLDMMAATEHDRFCAEDYRRLREVGIQTARDGLRWHLIDRGGAYEWSSWIPMLKAARAEGVQVIWDLFHYGWPDGLDIFSSAIRRPFCGASAARAARIHREHSDDIPFYSPVNEISFFAWAAARRLIFPYAHRYDLELKRPRWYGRRSRRMQNIRLVDARARFVMPGTVDPHGAPDRAAEHRARAHQRNSQFEAWDMIAGPLSARAGRGGNVSGYRWRQLLCGQ